MEQYRIFTTATGWMSITATERGLTSVQFPCPSERGAFWMLGKKVKQAERSEELLPDLVNRFILYFNGERVAFPDELDLSEHTAFQQKIWQAARQIPYGETRTYGWVAAEAGNPKASRAVGQALGRNPVPIVVPCHRVLASDGSLGGFSSGLKMKQRLLALESS